MAERASALVTILFTDLVGSTELLARAGDEDAQRIFRTHHDLLAEATTAHGGEEVKWLGDGLMVAFGSAADAVRCAVTMQQASRRPVRGERLAIRVGLNAGEALRDATDYFGTAVVVARRLCDRAEGGQILCSELVAGLLTGHAGFEFEPLGALELKGVPEPVAALGVRYGAESGPGLWGSLPFVGRESQLAHLVAAGREAAAGRGGLMFVVGEPGIGKTRLVEEAAEGVRREGFAILWGHCLEGEWSPPYAPFAEALEAMAARVDPEELRADLGAGGPALAQLAPTLRQSVAGLPVVAPVQPDEERFRLHDAMAQFLIARSRRAPLLVCLDDLHWADHSTVAMLRHVARFAPPHRLLVVGTYRDGEVGPGHPLHEALGGLRRDVEFERLKLDGLGAKDVGELLDALAEHDVLGAVASAIAAETDGNPFFIKEVLRHLVEEGRFVQGPDGRWTADRPIAELGIPEGVREVIDRRLARLSGDAQKLLSAASVFEGGDIRLGVAATVAELTEEAALDALDEMLDAQLLQPAGAVDVYGFTHALIRHTLASALSPSRRARLHLRAAEALVANFPGELAPARAGEIASQYHRAAGLPGAERGVDPAVAAADWAGSTGAHDEAARFLRMALDVLPEGDPRRPQLLGRLGLAQAWALQFESASAIAIEASGALAAAGDPDSAAEYLGEAAFACAMAGGIPHAWALARRGLALGSTRRDITWARMVAFDHQRQEAEDPDYPGIPLDTPVRRESARIVRRAHLDRLGLAPMEAVFDTRDEALESSNLVVRLYWAGETAGTRPAFEEELEQSLRRGQLTRAARCACFLANIHTAEGRLAAARASVDQARELGERVGQPNFVVVQVQAVLVVATDEGLEDLSGLMAPLVEANIPPLAWGLGFMYGYLALISARLGRNDNALAYLGRLAPWLERAPAWTAGFSEMASHAAEALWHLQRHDHAALVEQAVRDKVIRSGFRSTMADGRLALARLHALEGRYDDALASFAEARRTFVDLGLRPLLAIADYDEALMYTRRAETGDVEQSRPLIDTSLRRFEELGMTGWVRRAEKLRARM